MIIKYLFYLGESLQVWKFSGDQKELVATLDRNNKSLGLAERFEILWQDLWANKNLDLAQEVYLVIATGAGFTDGRIIFVWLENWKQFNPEKKFLIYKLNSQQTDIDFSDDANFKQLLESAQAEGSSRLVYSQEPRIGVKKIPK